MTHWQQCTRLLGNTFTWQKAMVLWVKRLSATPVPYSKCTMTEGTLRQMISEVTTHSSHPLYPVVFSISVMWMFGTDQAVSAHTVSQSYSRKLQVDCVLSSDVHETNIWFVACVWCIYAVRGWTRHQLCIIPLWWLDAAEFNHWKVQIKVTKGLWKKIWI